MLHGRASRMHTILPRTLEQRFWARQHQLDTQLAARLQTLEAERVRAEFKYNLHMNSLRRIRDKLRADLRVSLPVRSTARAVYPNQVAFVRVLLRNSTVRPDSEHSVPFKCRCRSRRHRRPLVARRHRL